MLRLFRLPLKRTTRLFSSLPNSFDHVKPEVRKTIDEMDIETLRRVHKIVSEENAIKDKLISDQIELKRHLFRHCSNENGNADIIEAVAKDERNIKKAQAICIGLVGLVALYIINDAYCSDGPEDDYDI